MNLDHFKTKLKSFGLKPKHFLGQNFLYDDILLEDIASSVPAKTGDLVLEIGPGLGSLTEKLLAKGFKVFAVEKDETMSAALQFLKAAHEDTFQTEYIDFLSFDLDAWTTTPKPQHINFPYHVCANIPYYITGKILRKLMEAKNPPQSITLLVQKEVAENLVAKPGKLSVLALSVQMHADVEYLFQVPAEKFFPEPQVDSAVVQIVPHKTPRYVVEDEKWFFKVVKACFLGKRKQIHNTLKNNLRIEPEKVTEILTSLGISATARPQELSIDQWIALANKLKS